MNLILVIVSLILVLLSTIIGAAFVFFFKKDIPALINNLIMGFAGGVMMAASFFCLLLESLEAAKDNSIYQGWHFVPITIGFLVGVIALFVLDKCNPHLHGHAHDCESGRHVHNSITKFIIAFAVHNIPEGISIGVACGLALNNPNDLSTALAVLFLSLGSAIHNIPLGSAISIPLYNEGESKKKSFLTGLICAFIEPLFAIVGLLLAIVFSTDVTTAISPWILSLAAGAIIYVTLDEMLPEARKGKYDHEGLLSFILGFVVLMVVELIF